MIYLENEKRGACRPDGSPAFPETTTRLYALFHPFFYNRPLKIGKGFSPSQFIHLVRFFQSAPFPYRLHSAGSALTARYSSAEGYTTPAMKNQVATMRIPAMSIITAFVIISMVPPVVVVLLLPVMTAKHIPGRYARFKDFQQGKVYL